MPEDARAPETVEDAGEAAVSVASVRRALEERLGIRMESVSGRVDWIQLCQEAAPFQPQAAHELGVSLRAFATLRDSVAGIRVAISNSRDWGEFELIRALASGGFGDPNASSVLDMAPFAGPEAMGLLLMPQVSGGTGDGISLLAAAMTDRKSGVLVFPNFDLAHPTVQSFLIDAIARGFAQDYSGRRLWLRGFACLLLIRNGHKSRLGFATSANSDDTPLNVDATVDLQKPGGPAVGQTIVRHVVNEIADQLGLEVKLEPEAEMLAERLSIDQGLTYARCELKRMLGRAIAERIARAPDTRLGAVVVGVEKGRLLVTRARALKATH